MSGQAAINNSPAAASGIDASPPPVTSTVKPSSAPGKLYIGAINPRALTEAILGRKIDWTKPEATQVMTDTLETPYNELFDMKYNSPIYAGLKLGPNNKAVPATAEDIKFMTTADRLTPNLGAVKKVGDLKNVGVTDVDSAAVQQVFLSGGKLHLVIDAPPALNKTLTNTALTQQVLDLVTPFGATSSAKSSPDAGWTPPGYSWRETGEMLSTATNYHEPIQGSVGDCWLIASLAAVAWAAPSKIEKRVRQTSTSETDQELGIKFYSDPNTGRNAPTMLVQLTDKTLVDSIGGWAPFCSCSDPGENWPQIYEKAFAKWATQDVTDQPNIATLSGGDPGAAIAQLTGKTPYYYDTASNSAADLWGIVRENSVAFKTVNPMTAWTYGSGSQYSGSNIVANHAYTILGWAWHNGKEYIVLRNPWGYFEPTGLNTYQGILSFFDISFWLNIEMVGNPDGVFALEAASFKLYYETMAVAK